MVHKKSVRQVSPTTAEGNPLVGVFQGVVERWAPLEFEIFPAATDSRMSARAVFCLFAKTNCFCTDSL